MKLLVIRMSSLGDVLLSTAFLESLPEGVIVDWVIRSEFAFALQGHPRIRKLIIFKKESGFKGWMALIRELHQADYDALVDLHVILRTRIAQLYWRWKNWTRPTQKVKQVFRISKGRFRFFAYTTFKNLLPRAMRPIPFWLRYADMAHKVVNQQLKGTTNPSALVGAPSYLPMLENRKGESAEILKRYGLELKKYFAVMPASRWKSKEWPVEKYAELCEALKKEGEILLLGRAHESSCQELMVLLKAKGITWVSALEENDFAVTAILLKNAITFVGGDTGLAHLTEAVGTRAVVIFGPTRPDLGFGPRHPMSRSVTADVFCSPCSKDGRICYRFFDSYACLKNITVDQVKTAVKS